MNLELLPSKRIDCLSLEIVRVIIIIIRTNTRLDETYINNVETNHNKTYVQTKED